MLNAVTMDIRIGDSKGQSAVVNPHYFIILVL